MLYTIATSIHLLSGRYGFMKTKQPTITATALASSACATDYKRTRAAVAVCVSSGKTTASAPGLSDKKETMRATLEIALLLLAGHFTLTDAVSELLHVILTTV